MLQFFEEKLANNGVHRGCFSTAGGSTKKKNSNRLLTYVGYQIKTASEHGLNLHDLKETKEDKRINDAW